MYIILLLPMYYYSQHHHCIYGCYAIDIIVVRLLLPVTVYDNFLVLVSNARKFAKPEMKEAVKEWER